MVSTAAEIHLIADGLPGLSISAASALVSGNGCIAGDKKGIS